MKTRSCGPMRAAIPGAWKMLGRALVAVCFAGRMLVGDCDGGFGCLWCGVSGFSCLIVGCAFRWAYVGG